MSKGNSSEYVIKFNGDTVSIEAAGKRTRKVIDDTESKAKKSSKMFGTLAQSMKKHFLGAGIALTMLAGITGIFRAGTDDLYKFDKGMHNVNTIINVNRAELKGMGDELMLLRRELGLTAEDSTNALYQTASAGIDAADSLRFVEIAGKSAVAGLSDTLTSVDGITTIVNAFHLEAERATEVADTMFQTVKLGKTTFTEISSSISQVAGMASAAGIEFKEIFAALSTLTKQGYPTSIAVTMIRQSIIGLNKQLGDGWAKQMSYQEGMKQIEELAGGSQNKLKEMMGRIEGVNAVLGMTGENAQMAQEDLEAMANSMGAMNAAYREQTESLEFRTNKLKTSVNSIGNSLAGVFIPVLLSVAETVDGTFNGMVSNVERVRKSFTYKLLALNSSITVYESLRARTNKTKVELQQYHQAITELKKAYPDYLGKIDLHKEKLENVRDAFKEVRTEMINTMRAEVRKAEVLDIVKEQEELIEKVYERNLKIAEYQTKLDKIAAGEIQDEHIYNKAQEIYERTSTILKQKKAQVGWQITDLQNEIDEMQKEIERRLALIPTTPPPPTLPPGGNEDPVIDQTTIDYAKLYTDFFTRQAKTSFNDYLKIFAAYADNKNAIVSNSLNLQEIVANKEMELINIPIEGLQHRAGLEQYLTETILEENERRYDSYAQTFSNMSGIMNAFFSMGMKKQGAAFALYKAFSATEIMISANKAAMAALVPPPIGLGPVAGLPLYYTTLGLGAVNAMATLMAKPGQVGGGASMAASSRSLGSGGNTNYDNSTTDSSSNTTIYVLVRKDPSDADLDEFMYNGKESIQKLIDDDDLVIRREKIVT